MASPELKNFLEKWKQFGDKTPEAQELRDQLWPAFDNNGNGYISLAEVEKGILEQVGEDLFRHYRPSYIRAFADAKDAAPVAPIEGASASSDDYITRREFRLLVVYLGYYAQWYELFSLLDGMSPGVSAQDDRRISRTEWEATLGAVKALASDACMTPWRAIETADEGDFASCDEDGKGYVLLNEFCHWMKRAEISAGTIAGQNLDVGEGNEK